MTFLPLWPWPWPNDLDVGYKTDLDTLNIPAYQNRSFYRWRFSKVRPQAGLTHRLTDTDRRDWVHYHAAFASGSEWFGTREHVATAGIYAHRWRKTSTQYGMARHAATTTATLRFYDDDDDDIVLTVRSRSSRISSSIWFLSTRLFSNNSLSASSRPLHNTHLHCMYACVYSIAACGHEVDNIQHLI